jgi:hypothetical protein
MLLTKHRVADKRINQLAECLMDERRSFAAEAV